MASGKQNCHCNTDRKNIAPSNDDVRLIPRRGFAVKIASALLQGRENAEVEGSLEDT
jgi:hypothetical protein